MLCTYPGLLFPLSIIFVPTERRRAVVCQLNKQHEEIYLQCGSQSLINVLSAFHGYQDVKTSNDCKYQVSIFLLYGVE